VNAETIAVGSEMLTPYRQDTNSLYLTDKLNELGVEVRFKSVVGDNSDDLTAAAKLAMRRSDIILLIGGLGPTEDDLTREAVAEALGLKLQRDPEILAKLEERFAKRGYKMSANNAKQADVLTGAVVLPNANGSAPGQWISGKYDGHERILILLPGPPNSPGRTSQSSRSWLHQAILLPAACSCIRLPLKQVAIPLTPAGNSGLRGTTRNGNKSPNGSAKAPKQLLPPPQPARSTSSSSEPWSSRFC